MGESPIVNELETESTNINEKFDSYNGIPPPVDPSLNNWLGQMSTDFPSNAVKMTDLESESEVNKNVNLNEAEDYPKYYSQNPSPPSNAASSPSSNPSSSSSTTTTETPEVSKPKKKCPPGVRIISSDKSNPCPTISLDNLIRERIFEEQIRNSFFRRESELNSMELNSIDQTLKRKRNKNRKHRKVQVSVQINN